MRSGFFNDTEVWAEDFARFCKGLLTDGVLADSEDTLKVTAGEGMAVIVNSGYCWIQGHFGLAESAEGIAIEIADGANPRIDRIVARLDRGTNSVYLHAITGTPAETPAAPDVVRNNTIYDLGLATVHIPAGTLSITDEMITDTRSDAPVCGGVIYRNADALALDGKADKIATYAKIDAQDAQLQDNIDDLDEATQQQINALVARVTALENRKLQEVELLSSTVTQTGAGSYDVPTNLTIFSATANGSVTGNGSLGSGTGTYSCSLNGTTTVSLMQPYHPEESPEGTIAYRSVGTVTVNVGKTSNAVRISMSAGVDTTVSNWTITSCKVGVYQ